MSPHDEQGPADPGPAHASRLPRILAFVLIAVSLASLYELRSFRRHVVELDRLAPAGIDLALAFLALASRTLLLLAVPVALAAACDARGRARLAWGVALGATVLLLGWLVLDVRLLRITGAHLHDYLVHADEPGGAEWAGDVGPILGPLLRVGGVTVVGLLALAWIVARARFLRHAWPWAILAVAIPLALLLGRGRLESPAVLERLYDAMAAPTLLNDPTDIPGAGRMGFGVAPGRSFEWTGAMVHMRLLSDSNVTIEPRNPMPTSRPHVVLFVVESLRHDALTSERMPRLDARAQHGLRFLDHTCAGNRSELGTFAILEGTLPLGYDQRLRADPRPTPALLQMFRDAGYETALIASCAFTWQKMDRFFAAPPFDTTVPFTDAPDWPTRDRQCLAEVARRIAMPDATPQFLVVYLMSSHWSYEFPPAYAEGKDLPPPTAWAARDQVRAEALRARYDLSLRYLDDLIGAVAESDAGKRALFVVTGDHGESFREDGVVGHATRLSEVQTRTSCVLFGPGVDPAQRHGGTDHVDLLPTLAAWLHPEGVRVRGGDGYNVLGQRDRPARLLWKPDGDGWGKEGELVLLDDGHRLHLRFEEAWRGRRRLRVLGFSDAAGHIDPKHALTPHDLPHWVEKLKGALGGASPDR